MSLASVTAVQKLLPEAVQLLISLFSALPFTSLSQVFGTGCQGGRWVGVGPGPADGQVPPPGKTEMSGLTWGSWAAH